MDANGHELSSFDSSVNSMTGGNGMENSSSGENTGNLENNKTGKLKVFRSNVSKKMKNGKVVESFEEINTKGDTEVGPLDNG